MAAVRYRSQHLVLEPSSWQVRVGEDSFTPEPKVFELLAYLMRNPGRVVPKAELLDSLWAGDVVGESVLTRCVSCVRKLLADDAHAPTFIRTVHGRGYEFVAPVSIQPVSSDEALPEQVASSNLPDIEGARFEKFVGRHAEIARLNELLRGVGAGRTKLVLVSGEAGIGKTRLLEEVTRGVYPTAVHWARASSVAGSPPFFLWRRSLLSIVKERSLKTVLRAFHDADADARKLVLGTDHWQKDNAPGWDSPNLRFRTFDAIARALAELAQQRPLVLVLDDLHAADEASLLLLAFVLEQVTAPLLFLGALRTTSLDTGSPTREAVTRVCAHSHVEIALGGLERAEVEELVQSKLSSPPAGLVNELHLRTGGNPFFLSVLGPQPVGERLPAVVRQAVASRLASLPPECLALLQVAAVCGHEFDGPLLARVTNSAIAPCLALLRTAVKAQLVIAAAAEHFRFAHDLVREVIYDDLHSERRARTHLALGQLLETLPDYQRAAQAAVLAHHFAQALDFGGASRALDLSICAGAYALRNYAYEDAVQHFARASRLLPLCPDADPATGCAVLLDLGLSQVSAGLRDAGQETLRLAAAKARAQGSTEVLASVALGLVPGLLSIENGVYDAGLVELLREAMAQVGHDNDRLRALLLARLALALYWSDTFDERVRICAEAQALAERLGADDVLAAVGTARAFALIRPSNLEERLALAERMIELCRRVGDQQLLLLNRLLLRAALMESADLAAAAFEGDAFRKLAEEIRQPQSLWIVQAHLASRLLLDGRLDEVEALAGKCLMTGQRTRDHNALLTFGVHLTLVRIEQERAHEVLDVVRDFAARYPRIVGWRVLHAYALQRAGRLADSDAEYQSLKANQFALPDDLNWPLSMAWLAETCHALGDREGAAWLYERFAPFAARLVVVGFGIGCAGSVERYLGLLCETLGRLPAALEHYERAVRINRATAVHLPLAYTLLEYANALLATGEDQLGLARRQIDDVEAFARDRQLAALTTALASTRARLRGREQEITTAGA